MEEVIYSKKLRNSVVKAQKISTCINGEVGAQNIAYPFQEIYENLYSQHTLGEYFDKL